jgi:predicted transcriptional regulator
MEKDHVLELLKKRRETLGITQSELAQMAQVGLRTVKTLESLKCNPTLVTIERLARVLGMELELVIKKM